MTHINEKLRHNIQTSPYFKELYELRTYQEVVKEIEAECRCIETFQKGSSENPTKFMCLLYKVLIMRLTKNQVSAMAKHNNVFVKTMGLLYMRMVGKFEELWGNLKGFLDDEKWIFTKIDQTERITIG